jgi:hypothetical protein
MPANLRDATTALPDRRTVSGGMVVPIRVVAEPDSFIRSLARRLQCQGGDTSARADHKEKSYEVFIHRHRNGVAR